MAVSRGGMARLSAKVLKISSTVAAWSDGRRYMGSEQRPTGPESIHCEWVRQQLPCNFYLIVAACQFVRADPSL